VAVAEELHFRRAAERLHVAQPAVSEQIRKLEDELGVRLLERTQRRVSLTEAGAAMLEESRRVLHQADIAQAAARNARDRASTRLSVGYLPDSLPGSISRALQHLTADAPLVQTRLETGSSLPLIDAVRTSRLDAAVVALPGPVNGLDPEISLRRLAPERVVVMPRETNPPFHNAVASICRDAGLAPTLIEVDEPRVEQVLLAVAAGAGPALLPESATERFATPGIRFVPLEGGEAAFDSAVVTRPGTESLATLSFLRAIARTRRPGVVGVPRPAVSLAA